MSNGNGTTPRSDGPGATGEPDRGRIHELIDLETKQAIASLVGEGEANLAAIKAWTERAVAVAASVDERLAALGLTDEEYAAAIAILGTADIWELGRRMEDAAAELADRPRAA